MIIKMAINDSSFFLDFFQNCKIKHYSKVMKLGILGKFHKSLLGSRNLHTDPVSSSPVIAWQTRRTPEQCYNITNAGEN